MKKILVVLAASAVGCYGFVVCPAMAGERWSPDACRRLQELKVSTYRTNKSGPEHLAWMLTPILAAQQSHCGVDTERESDASIAAVPRSKPGAVVQPRQPMFCDTTPKAYGGSYTDCF